MRNESHAAVGLVILFGTLALVAIFWIKLQAMGVHL